MLFRIAVPMGVFMESRNDFNFSGVVLAPLLLIAFWIRFLTTVSRTRPVSADFPATCPIDQSSAPKAPPESISLIAVASSADTWPLVKN